MSADNWAVCPRCLAKERARVAALQAHVQEVYGSVVVEEFDTLRREADAAEAALPDFKQTFREDYEFYGVEEGTVIASYSGLCLVCGLSLSFKDEHPIPGLGGDDHAPE